MPTDSLGQLEVFGHCSDPLGMYCTHVGNSVGFHSPPAVQPGRLLGCVGWGCTPPQYSSPAKYFSQYSRTVFFTSLWMGNFLISNSVDL